MRGASSIIAWLAAVNLTIAAASDLQAVLPEIAARFESATGVHATLAFGSSGNLSTQIENGAPFDVFLSADVAYPERLIADRHAFPDTLVRYARGRLVLWTRADSGLDVGRGLSVLTDAAVRRIAIANPEHAPYGRAAVEAMRRAQVYDRVREKLVLGENISQAAQFARSGNADAGLLARSLALGAGLRDVGRFVDVPSTLHAPIEQAAVVLSRSKEPDAARRFVAFLRTSEIAELLRASGFEAQ